MKKQFIAFAVLSLTSCSVLASTSANSMCPPSYAFKHGKPGTHWYISSNYSGWRLDDSNAVQSPVKQMPMTALGIAEVDMSGNLGYVECYYRASNPVNGQMDAYKAVKVNKAIMQAHGFTYNAADKSYECHFGAGIPNTCAWN